MIVTIASMTALATIAGMTFETRAGNASRAHCVDGRQLHLCSYVRYDIKPYFPANKFISRL